LYRGIDCPFCSRFIDSVIAPVSPQLTHWDLSLSFPVAYSHQAHTAELAQ